jgi:signal transduction histidine kinase
VTRVTGECLADLDRLRNGSGVALARARDVRNRATTDTQDRSTVTTTAPPAASFTTLESCPLASALAARLRAAKTELTMRWLERIVDRVSIDENRVFPSEELLDHMPVLIDGVADYLENPSNAVGADSIVVAKAMELGALRHAQGFAAYQVLKEYEIFGGILFAYLAATADDVDESCTRAELLTCAHRVFHAVVLVQQATSSEYLRLATEKLTSRDERLRAFNRTLTHELRNRIGAAAGASEMLTSMDLAEADRRALAGVVARNVGSMRTTLEHLLELSRVDQSDVRQQRHVMLPRAAAEAARQLRDLARAHGVEVRLRPLPEFEVNAAAVELCLTNLISNAVKYSDPAKPQRWVEVSGETALDLTGMPEVIVRVRDNGLGVPEEQRAQLFARFFRAHEHSAMHVEGTGLGLSIVLETVRALGGRAWATFPAEGSEFAFALPSRREAEA